MDRLRRLVILTSRGPLAPVWSLAYRIAARVVARRLRGGEEVAVYARAGFARGEQVPGLSDIDLAVIAPDEAAVRRARERWATLRERLSALGRLVECFHIETPAAVAGAARHSVLTHGLDAQSAGTPHVRMQERPVLAGQLSDWRRLAGPDLLPQAPTSWSEEQRPAVAWLDLQYWWRHAFVVAPGPDVPWLAASCVKLVAEPLRIALWLEDGDPRGTKQEVLAEGLRAMPELAPGLRHAQDLWRRLHREPQPDLDLVIETLHGTTRRVAATLERLAAAEPTTAVRLVGAGDPLPLADWRARALPQDDPFHAFEPLAGSPGDRDRIVAACAAARRGVYPALGAGSGLMVLPTVDAAAARLRGVECGVTDPVSQALARGETAALFPELPGWSASDSARRAVHAHALALAGPDDLPSSALLGAARAALFRQSIEDGDPELLLTASAVERALDVPASSLPEAVCALPAFALTARAAT